MSPDQRRVLEQASSSAAALTSLWRALLPLKTVVTVLQTGAHPDDETSRLLARLRSDGLRLAFACATRGQGGQNAIGPEAGADLGLLRTAEMEAAARALDMGLYWLSASEDDPITDFGFSKSGEDTLRRWGEAHLLERLVRVFRLVRPDIVLPAFLDVGGQHGHHRAITRMSEAAFHAAADPAAFPEQGLAPWSVAKFYLPAFGGAGGSYDDEEPPPPATLTIEVGGVDPMFGATYAQIGEWSRVHHLCQGMGRWHPPGSMQANLHLKASRVGPAGPEGCILDRLPRTLADIADGGDRHLAAAQAAIDEAVAAFPDRASVAAALARAQEPLIQCTAAPEHAHRVGRTRELIERALAEATLPTAHAPVEPVAAGPRVIVAVTPARLPLPIGAPTAGPVRIAIENSGAEPFAGLVEWEAPAGWGGSPAEHVRLTVHAASAMVEARLVPPADLRPGLYTCPILLDGKPAHTTTTIAYDHIRPICATRPALVQIRALHVALPKRTRIAFVDGGSDCAAEDFSKLGMAMVPLSDSALRAGDFSSFDTVLVGVFALRARPALQEALPALKAWVEAGGKLVTLYHRPWDAWDPDATPPARIEIGQPSLRFRITDPTAPVTVLVPDHPLFNTPNRIGAEDWDGWVKERGLYFAKSWADPYTPLLAIADPGEAPHRGALLAGRFGRGLHAHVALALHTQLAELVPGAYRLMANLLAKVAA